jgi:hypothetical protein
LASQNYTPVGPFYSAISHCARPRSVVFIHGSCPRHAYTQTPRGIAQVLPGGHLLDAVQCRSADHTGQSVSQNVHHHVAVHTQDRVKQCGMERSCLCLPQFVGGFLPVRLIAHCGVTPVACTPAQVSQGGHAPGTPGFGTAVQGGAQMQPSCVSRPPYSTGLQPVFGSP